MSREELQDGRWETDRLGREMDEAHLSDCVIHLISHVEHRAKNPHVPREVEPRTLTKPIN